MTGSVPPPGWYPDPANDQQLRWWTGERWTGAARPVELEEPPGVLEHQPREAVADDTGSTSQLSQDTMAMSSASTAASESEYLAPAAQGWGASDGTDWADDDGFEDGPADDDGWPRERMIAAIVIGGLLLTSVAIWLFAVVMTGSGDGEIAATGDAATGGDESEDSAVDDAEAGEAGEAGDGDSGADEDDSGTSEAEPEVVEGDRTVDFDGRCTVELDAAVVDSGRALRPWQFDECTGAPVDLDGGDGRWIVVIASMDGELDQEQARSRAEDRGSGYGLLWSTHYPSLNPGWWVVFDGPFSEEDAATDVADSVGGGAYPRLLSDDEGDRYCIAEDGC